ncbi:ROK family protein [Microbacterium sp. 2P01SA-2]|uniref:ROK family protein n=1 Tax=unclassified Microbacterium TaxID=2609290 RepID=UPI0039A03E84
MTLRIGVDVGGTKILAVSVDDDGGEIARLRRPTGWGGDAVADGVAAVVADLAGAERDAAVGVGVPGQILPGSGIVEHALNLGIERYDLAGAVAARLGIRPSIDNDVRYAAVGAHALRPSGGSLAYLNLGTGIAAGIVDESGPRRGSRGAAGEIGHIPIDPGGPRCRCGQRGCIEAFSGGGAVAERWGGSEALPVLAVFDAADAGDERAAGIRAGVVRGVEAAVRLLVLTTDVDVVVLGGGVAALADRLLVPVRTALVDSAAASPFLRSLRLDERVELVPRDAPVGALGAAVQAQASGSRCSVLSGASGSTAASAAVSQRASAISAAALTDAGSSVIAKASATTRNPGSFAASDSNRPR